MSKAHGWDEQSAKHARAQFGLNLTKRSQKEPILKYVCPFPHCQKPVVRIRNHLRQQHKVREEEAIKEKLIDIAIFKDYSHCQYDEPEASEGSDDDIDEEDQYVARFFQQQFHNDNESAEEDDDDPDWLTTRYFEVRLNIFLSFLCSSEGICIPWPTVQSGFHTVTLEKASIL